MFRRLVIMFIVLWLPLQGVVAAVMPFCKHAMAKGVDSSSTQHSSAVDHGHHTQHASSDTSTHSERAEHRSDGSALVKLACDNCDVCHLACATFIPAQHHSVCFALVQVYQPYFTPFYNLLAPEQLLQPPRPSSCA